MLHPHVRLGFEVQSGDPVEIPVRHIVVCGITQEAGKTTLLEGLIARSGRRAVTFVTKRGESAFTAARRVRPYFREQADWQFVASILEASRGERLKFERAWIIRASRGAHTLAGVQANIKRLMAKATGMSADVYLTLDAYLDVVVPAIGSIDWAPALDLEPGVNAVDLTDVPTEMQHLVIKSCIDWVLTRETDTIVVIPEAWKFVPEGRGTPVKRAADALIRQGAALRNYVWLDSQDLGGVAKEMLRHVSVWLLGVQRESNEIKRTLANIPTGVSKPTAAQLATLELGQFFACWKTHVVRVYAQPVWLPDDVARGVARGERRVDDVGRFLKEESVTKKEAEALLRENKQLRVELDALKARWTRTDAVGTRGGKVTVSTEGPHPPDSDAFHTTSGYATSSEAAKPEVPMPKGRARQVLPASFDTDDATEQVYQAFKARLIAEAPSLLRVLTERHEVEVVVERRTVQVDGGSLKGRIARLMAAGFFDEAKTQGNVRTELKRTGSDVNQGTLWRAITDFVKDGFLTAESGNTYRMVAEMKVNIVRAA